MTQLYVKVEPGSDEFRIEQNSFPLFHLEEPAENGRANTELCKKLEEILGKKVGIVSGHHSKRKKIAVDMTENEFKSKIEDYKE